jgi:hypothetical protein
MGSSVTVWLFHQFLHVLSVPGDWGQGAGVGFAQFEEFKARPHVLVDRPRLRRRCQHGFTGSQVFIMGVLDQFKAAYWCSAGRLHFHPGMLIG